MTDARERALATIARVDAMLREPAPETETEWAARAPETPDAIARWMKEAPVRSGTWSGPPTAPPQPERSGEIAALKAKVASLETKLTIATSRKGQAARRRGRGYLSAEYGGRDA